MFNLIRKDFKLSFKINIFALIYALFICFTGTVTSNYFAASLFYVLGIIIVVSICVIYINGYDDKYNIEVVLNSFPIDRKDIVRGKYLVLITYILVFYVLTLFFTTILTLMGINQSSIVPNIWHLIAATDILFIFYSIYYPFYFKLGEGIRVFNIVLWMLMFVGPAILSKTGKRLEEKGILVSIQELSLEKITICTLIGALIIYYISLQISKKIYMEREF